MKKTLAIIGAGPIGLEAALAAIEKGYEVRVFERGEVGDAVRRWGHVKMFSPFGMNVSLRGVALLRKEGYALPDADAILLGREYVAEYLAPLGEVLDELIRTNVEVVSIGRAGSFKHELKGEEERREMPLRLLLSKGEREWVEHFDIVFDCSGTFSTPNRLGDGGMLAIGERSCQECISYGVPDVAGRQRAAFRGRKVMVVGAGHSAATVIRDLTTLDGSEVVWITRMRSLPPCREIEGDPLSERSALAREANQLVETGVVDLRPGLTVLSVERQNGRARVTLIDEYGESEETTVDRIVAAVGFRPDLELTRELQTQLCWATEGTYKLAASLLGESAGDCMAVKATGAEVLVHPEPNYFTLGIKSYGRSPDFLIRTGRAQVESVLEWLDQREAREAQEELTGRNP